MDDESDAMSAVIEQLREAVIGLAEVAEALVDQAAVDPAAMPNDRLAYLQRGYQRVRAAVLALDRLPHP